MKSFVRIPWLVGLALGVTQVSWAADYFVDATNGSDTYDGSSAEAAFATIDQALTTGGGTAGNTIYLLPGTYTTDQQWGFDLKANLVGMGATRDEVIVQSAGNYRTLRMNSSAKPLVTNLTVVGCADFKADKGGAIEMNGGKLIDCVVRDGTTYGNGSNLDGGNIYMAGDSLIDSCLITGGRAKKRGGNVYLDGGIIRNSQIVGGQCENVGGNVFQYGGTIEKCVIENGSAVNDGGNVRQNGGGTIQDTVIANGSITSASGSKKGVNVYMDSSAKLIRCQLKGGTHASYDGASLCVYSSSCSVENTLIEGSGCGGALLGGTSKLYNCSIINNQKYGIWSWTANQTLVNCVIYGNTNAGAIREWSGNQPTHSQATFLNCATSAGSLSQTTFPTLVVVAEGDFVDYAGGNYRPTEYSALVDAGATDPRGQAASSTDLDGLPRMSGTVDIGCYEYQKQELVVRIESVSITDAFAPAQATFTHIAEHSAAPASIVYTYDFGDGTEAVSTSDTTITHTYATAGTYSVTVTVTNTEVEESASMTYEGYVKIASSVVYVTPNNTKATFPYDTPETGYALLRTAVNEAVAGRTIYLTPGAHEYHEQTVVDKAIRLIGLGATPAETVVRNTTANPNSYYHRTLEVKHADAYLSNLTIENGRVVNNNGANLRLVAGTVTNCIIRNGYVRIDGTGNGAGAAVELAGAATLTHCVITNNLVEGTSGNQGVAGGAIFVTYGAKNGRISNCLIAYNRFQTLSTDAVHGSAGVRFGGSNDNTQLEANTIVGNVVEGELINDAAGVHCTTWYGRLRNNIIAGNYETVKARNTAIHMDVSHGTFLNNLTDDAEPYAVQNYAAPLDQIFVNYAAGNLLPKPGGAAFNRATTAGLVLTPSVDLAGQPRIFGRAPDIGCYEVQRNPGCLVIFY